MIFSIETDINYLIKDNVQAICLSDRTIRKSFILEDFPEVNGALMFQLEDKAVLTDCLSHGGISSSGFLINSRLRKVFEKFELMNHKYYEAQVKDHKGKLHTYYWMQLKQNLTDYIDFPTSEFIEMDMSNEVGAITLQSFNEFDQKRKELGWEWNVKTKKLVIKPNTPIEKLDLFKIFPFTPKIYASKDLKDAISASGLKGLSFDENKRITFK